MSTSDESAKGTPVETSAAGGGKTACCDASEQESCCDPAEKAECCAPEATAAGACGCQ